MSVTPTWTLKGPEFYSKGERYWTGLEVIRFATAASGKLPTCGMDEAQATYDYIRYLAAGLPDGTLLGSLLPPARFVQGRAASINLLDDESDPSTVVIPWTTKRGDALRFAVILAFAVQWQAAKDGSGKPWHAMESSWAGLVIAFLNGLPPISKGAIPPHLLLGSDVENMWESLKLPIKKTKATVA